MTETPMPLGAITNQTKDAEKDSDCDECWRSFTALLCLAGGVSFGIIGLFLSSIGYFSAAGAVEVNVGTTMVFSSVPLMILGAHASRRRRASEETTKI